jgi:VanZ family protein
MSVKKYPSLKYLLLTLSWALLIYYLSSIPDLKSSFDSSIDLILRKGAHIFAYAILAYLLAKIFDKDSKANLAFAFITSILYAFSDEWHQLSIGGRSGSPIDIMVDSFGVLWGIIFYRFLKK